MSTHNMFLWRNKKAINTFCDEESALSGSMDVYYGIGNG